KQLTAGKSCDIVMITCRRTGGFVAQKCQNSARLYVRKIPNREAWFLSRNPKNNKEVPNLWLQMQESKLR
ncbi:MAG: hypothetical protein LUB58_01720, partial [Oscillospiraceae bacterium]|nr:hypothetical protein [Oscillospiraceae bacterium]